VAQEQTEERKQISLLHPTYILDNKTSDLTLHFHQSSKPNYLLKSAPNTLSIFSWLDPTGAQAVQTIILLVEVKNKMQKLIELSPDDLEFKERIDLS
jgi:hypothetical protein